MDLYNLNGSPNLDKYLVIIKNKIISLINIKFNGTLEFKVNFKYGGITGINIRSDEFIRP